MLLSISLLVRNEIVSIPKKSTWTPFLADATLTTVWMGIPCRDPSSCPWCVRARWSRKEFAKPNRASGRTQ
jgi:hypothetical protein